MTLGNVMLSVAKDSSDDAGMALSDLQLTKLRNL